MLARETQAITCTLELISMIGLSFDLYLKWLPVCMKPAILDP